MVLLKSFLIAIAKNTLQLYQKQPEIRKQDEKGEPMNAHTRHVSSELRLSQYVSRPPVSLKSPPSQLLSWMSFRPPSF